MEGDLEPTDRHRSTGSNPSTNDSAIELTFGRNTPTNPTGRPAAVERPCNNAKDFTIPAKFRAFDEEHLAVEVVGERSLKTAFGALGAVFGQVGCELNCILADAAFRRDTR